MIVCPKCGNEVVKPDKKIETPVFCVAAFTCPKSGNNFKDCY